MSYQNVFVMSTSPQWWVKIADFGISKRINSDQTALRTRIGTPRYLAPEVEDDELLDSDYTQAVDIWSLGCVVYHVLVREPPFLTTSSKSKPFPEAQLESRSLDMALKFLRTLLVRDPSQRATARDALSSDWLLNANESLDADFGPSRAESEVKDHLFSQDTKGRQPLQTAFDSAVAGLTIADNPTKFSPRNESLLTKRFHFENVLKRFNAPTLESSMSGELVDLRCAPGHIHLTQGRYR
jgi:serine/threonine protein kinase